MFVDQPVLLKPEFKKKSFEIKNWETEQKLLFFGVENLDSILGYIYNGLYSLVVAAGRGGFGGPRGGYGGDYGYGPSGYLKDIDLSQNPTLDIYYCFSLFLPK